MKFHKISKTIRFGRLVTRIGLEIGLGLTMLGTAHIAAKADGLCAGSSCPTPKPKPSEEVEIPKAGSDTGTGSSDTTGSSEIPTPGPGSGKREDPSSFKTSKGDGKSGRSVSGSSSGLLTPTKPEDFTDAYVSRACDALLNPPPADCGIGLTAQGEHESRMDSEMGGKACVGTKYVPTAASGLPLDSDQEDAWCANQGEGYANNERIPAPGSGKAYKLAAGTEPSSSEYDRRLLRCKFKYNSGLAQFVSYCQAHQAIDSNRDPQHLMRVMDVTAAAVCATACAASVATVGMGVAAAQGACSLAGTAANVTEIVQIVRQKESWAGVLGMAGGGTAVALGVTTGAELAGSTATKGVAEAAAKEAGKSAGTSTASTALSCVTAAFFTASAIVRQVNLNSAEEADKQVLDSARKFLSDANIFTPDGQYKPGAGPSGTPLAKGDGSGGSKGTGGTFTTVDPKGRALDCVASSTDTINCYPKSLRNAAEADILTKSGLDKLIAPLAKDNMAGIDSKLKSGGSVGSTIADAMGAGLGGSDVGRAVKDLSDHPPSALAALGGGSTYSSGGGRTPAGGGDSSGLGGLAGLFGGAGASGPAGPQGMQFGKANAVDNDIWHANFKGSIFEIVSQKLARTNDRVEKVDWASPMNRALTGTNSQVIPQGKAK